MNSAYLVRRLLQVIPLLVGVSILGFGMMQLAPGGFAALYTLNPNVSSQDIERIKEAWGLNRPLWQQYLTWVGNMFTGDWGHSFRGGAPVSHLIWERVPATVQLMATAYALAIVLGFLIGTIGATRQYSVFDYFASTGALVALSIPTFWFGLMVIYLFAERLGWIPSGGYRSLSEGGGSLGDRLHHLVAPALVLAFVLTAQWSRYFRSSLLDVIHQDYVRTAYAKGLAGREVMRGHILRNAVLPIIALAGVQLPAVFGGALVTESVFAWAGMGRLFLDALTYRDFPVLMALLMVTAILVVVGNLIADIALSFVDPRIRVR
ncbi:MAG: peptide/nickel transport system permease protein [Thermomicrobiales bacterium]|jgi:peptide/nickel transport system permease protein|nr:peptide/nickel transport system permease protein [Thermomicrobiales bacterium]MEA2528606.1 peptide/nickel transport system permease protein [Thermomicrobiales bacterium]MEA2582928.1 peptide/nickel transport system permease protein [Thermomicrobiales bacterium]MEA2596958.1 peptide/nickel transport system permease protein [Thermomicrobiales bacterium]